MRLRHALLVLAVSPSAYGAAMFSPYFEENRGQAAGSAVFVARGPGYTVALRQDGKAEYRMPGQVNVRFPGARPARRIQGEQPLPAVTNFYRDGVAFPAIPHMRRVRFRQIYPGIDLVWRSRSADLEYEFLAYAGSRPERIRVRFEGADRLSLDGDGNLVLETSSGRIRHRRPVAWQEIDGRRREVAIAMRLQGDTVRFELGPYDRRQPLSIDPVLVYSTYVGGAGYDAGYGIAVDAAGGVYVTGTTSSIGFPAQGSSVNSNTEAFVMKFDARGTLLYNTILASNGTTSGQAIAIDLSGNAYIAGTTQATDFPVSQGACQTVFGGLADAFAAKLGSTGQRIYATYLGGMGQETGTGIAIDPAGNAYISGYTSSVFPTTGNAAQRLYGGGFSDAFLVKLNPAGTGAVYSTLLGGTGTDLAEAVVVDSMGQACIAGYTDSVNLAVRSALEPVFGGQGDGLIACLSSDGRTWTMVSYLGGSGLDQAYALAIDPAGYLYVAGTSFSQDFPVTAGVAQTVNAGGYDAFVAKLAPGGADWIYSTLLGGNASDAALAIDVDVDGSIWVGGYTASTDFPLSNAWQTTEFGSFDGFLTHLGPNGSLLNSTYLGGTGDDRVLGIALDANGQIFATGYTLSPNFPVTYGAMLAAAPAGANAFLAGFNASSDSISGQVTNGSNFMSGVTIQLTGSTSDSTTTDDAGYYRFIVPTGGDYVVTPSLSGYDFGPRSLGYTDMRGSQTANFTASLTTTLTISGRITLGSAGLGGTAVALTGSQTANGITDSSGNYTFTVQAGGTYTVTPSRDGFSFSPPLTTFSGLGANQTADFAAQCSVSVSPLTAYLDSTSQAGPSLTVTAGPGCTWTASGGGFLTIASGSGGSGNGTVTFNTTANSSGVVRTGALAIGGQTVTVTQRSTADIFADVAPPDYYFDFAGIMYQAGITGGCSAEPLNYCPSSNATRGQMAVFLIAAIEGGASFTYTTTPYFTDVPASHPYFKFVQKLKDLGITGGCGPNRYCPDDPVSRGQMAVFIIAARYEKTPFTYPSTPYFTDVPASNSFFPFIQKMAQTGITGGCAPGLYCPNNTLTRGQMAVFIVTGLLNRLLPAGTPVITLATPSSAARGRNVTVTLAGSNTHFVQGSTHVTVPPGITASNVTVLSATSLRMELAIGATFVPNPITIVATTGIEEAVLPNRFLVQ